MKIGLSLPPDFSPGKDWLYSNTGYVILGMLIEKITGNSYSEEIEKRIIEPLDLPNTFFTRKFTRHPRKESCSWICENGRNRRVERHYVL